MRMSEVGKRLPPAARELLHRAQGSSRLAACRRWARRALAEVRLRDPWLYVVYEGARAGGGGPLCLHYLGRRRFAADFLALFDRGATGDKVAERPRGGAGLGALWEHARRLGAWPPGADVLVVDRLLPPLPPLPRGEPSTSYVPFIEARLGVAEDMEAQLARVRSKGHRRKLAQALKRGFTWRKSHAEADFDTFYARMYEPFVKDRFRLDGAIVGREDMRRVFSRRGFLLLLEEEDRPVAGALMYVPEGEPKSLAYWKYGLADSASLSGAKFGERNGMTEAMVLKFAVDNHYQQIDFGLTRALPNDGIFTHKKRLGCDFTLPKEFASFSFCAEPKARAALFAAQPVVVEQGGRLIAWMGHHGELAAGDKAALAEALRAAFFPSLGGIDLFVDAQEPASRLAIDEVVAELARELGAPCRARPAPTRGP